MTSLATSQHSPGRKGVSLIFSGKTQFGAEVSFRLIYFSFGHQVSTKRTSSCPQALHCPAGGALATARPVRFRSSAALGASSVRASRRSCDQPNDGVLLCVTHPSSPSACQIPPRTRLFTNLVSSAAVAPRRNSSEFLCAARDSEESVVGCRRVLVWTPVTLVELFTGSRLGGNCETLRFFEQKNCPRPSFKGGNSHWGVCRPSRTSKLPSVHILHRQIMYHSSLNSC